MIFFLIGIGLVLLYLPLITYGVGRRLPADQWYRMVVASLVAGALAVGCSLALIAAPPLLRAVGAGEVARICDRFLGHLPHGTPIISSVAGVLLLVGLVSVGGRNLETRRALRKLTVVPSVGIHIEGSYYDLVVLPSRRPLAYSRHSGRPQVVVTQALVDLLSAEEMRVLVRHELAHIRYRHEQGLRLLSSIEGAFNWLPRLSRSVSVARLAMERVADEEAVGVDPVSRHLLARALVVTATGIASPAVPAFNGIQGVKERLLAMTVGTAPLPQTQRFGLMVSAGLLRFGVFAMLLASGVCFS